MSFSFFRGLELMHFEGIFVPLQKATALLLLYLLASFGLRGASLGMNALLIPAVGVTIVVAIIAVKYFYSAPSAAVMNGIGYKVLLKEAVMLGMVVFLWQVYFRIDSFMLGYMKGNYEVGIYNVAYKILEGIFFFPGIIMTVFFPRLARPELFSKTFMRLSVLLGVSGLFISILSFFVSPFLIGLIYGPRFKDSIAVFQVLSLAVLPVFLGNLVTQSLVCLDLNRLYVSVAGAGAIFNIALNFFLIPAFGGKGAAVATIVTEMLVLFSCSYIIFRKRPAGFDRRMILSVFAEITSSFGIKRSAQI